ncbi:hypothetical protein J2777_005963 [Paraburkholderia graminis]|uniref:DUF6527 family protein n=1 Tax=Paraburkholderia graminis TaxID=60548 RepID=UPI002865949C|nr:DUF6527 family protein [Paraburkholderia graminis]MDR6472222.1 hypothetical protein [Paraburkholderia graminis]
MANLFERLWKKAVACYDSMCGRYRVVAIDEFPDRMASKTVYAVGEEGQYWLAALRCPCGCGDTIQLSMMEGQRPQWTLVDRHMRFPTLAPSVDRTVGCRSHFFLRSGKIQWCT